MWGAIRCLEVSWSALLGFLLILADLEVVSLHIPVLVVLLFLKLTLTRSALSVLKVQIPQLSPLTLKQVEKTCPPRYPKRLHQCPDKFGFSNFCYSIDFCSLCFGTLWRKAEERSTQ